MSTKITYYVHGTTTDNEQEICSGWFDVDLSELGVNQSKGLRNQSADKVFDVVFCSDLRRAVHTANLAFGGRFKIIQDRRLRECNYGDFNAQPASIVEPMEVNNIQNRFPNGESYADVEARISDFLDSIKSDYPDKHIAIVAHQAPQLALDVVLKHMSWQEAFEKDWRKTKSWQPGWEYVLE